MNKKTRLSRNQAFNIFLYIFFFLMCACFVLPLIVVISASFTSEQVLTSGGFSLLPRDFTLDAYKSAFSSGARVLRAYGGQAVAVYQDSNRAGVEDLLAKGRVDFIFPADYRDGTLFDETMKNIVRKIAIADALAEENQQQLRSLGRSEVPQQVGLF